MTEVDCENAMLLETDTQSLGRGKCKIGRYAELDETTTAAEGAVGTIIIADTITIDGIIDLGQQSLILAARKRIQFEPGSRIVGANARGSLGKAENSCEGETKDISRWGIQRRGPTCCGKLYPGDYCQGCETTHIRDSAISYTSGGSRPGDGRAGDSSGSLLLISPSIAGSGLIQLDGQAGEDGGDGPTFRCHNDDPYCWDSLEKLKHEIKIHNGGYGGDGGNGGNLVVISDSRLPTTITFRAKAGQGGSGGSPSMVKPMGLAVNFAQQWDGKSTPPYNKWFWLAGGEKFGFLWTFGSNAFAGSTKGEVGKPGAQGIQTYYPLNGGFSELAYLVARRGAARLALDGNYYGRSTDPETIDGPINRRTAIARFERLQQQYCADFLSDRGAVSSDFVLPGTRQARHALCNEATVRLGPLRAGLNYFGFSDDMLVYITPDVMRGFHETIVELSDNYRDAFWASADIGAAAELDAQLDKSENLKEERELARDIALATRDHYANRVMIALARIARNQEIIEEHMEAINEKGNQVQDALRAPSTSVWDMMTRFVSLAISIGKLASGSIDAVGNLAGFVSSFAGDTSFDQLIGSLRDAPSSSIGDVVKIFDEVENYADRLVNGLEIEGKSNRPGIDDIVGSLKKAKDGAKGLFNSEVFVEAPKLEELIDRDISMELKLRESMETISGARSMVEKADPGTFRDQQGALGMMTVQLFLIEEAIKLNRESQNLTEEHMLAAAELSLAKQRLDLAELELANTDEELRSVECRAGQRTGYECHGIPALFGLKKAERYRDSLCQLAKKYDDQALLFDFLYQRSLNYASLSNQETARARRATNYRKTLLDPANRVALDERKSEEVWNELANQFVEHPSSDVFAIVCDPETPCGQNYTSGYSSSHAMSIVHELRSHGMAQFSLDDACHEDESGVTVCNSFLANELPRQRVTEIRAKMIMRDGYRLGCKTAHGCPPDLSPGVAVDKPVGEFLYDVKLSHGPLATFKWDDDGDHRTFEFANRNATDLCALAQRYTPQSRLNCENVVHFQTGDSYRTPSTYVIDNLGKITPNKNNDPRVFGTSIRGTWQIDLRQTIVELSSAGDDCYSDLSGADDRCLPDECSNTSVTMLDENDLPSDVTIPMPSYCELDDNGVTQLFSVCDQYVDYNAQQPIMKHHGDLECCSSAGRLRNDLTAQQRTDCSGWGWTSDSCKTPDDCYRICGPKCRAFKEALEGFEVAISWMSEATD